MRSKSSTEIRFACDSAPDQADLRWWTDRPSRRQLRGSAVAGRQGMHARRLALAAESLMAKIAFSSHDREETVSRFDAGDCAREG